MRRDEPATMMHLIRPMLLLVAVAVLLLIAETAKSDSLRVHDVAGSDGPEVLLSHVAELEGEYANGFAKVVIGRFVEGESRIDIKTSSILEAIREEGAKLGLLDLSGFTRVTVHRTFNEAAKQAEREASQEPIANVESLRRGEPVTVYSPTTVKALIEQTIAKRIGLSLLSLKITFNDRDKELLAKSAVAGRYEVQPIAEPTLGAVSFKVTGYHGTKAIDKGQTISARVQQRVIAVVAGEKIGRGDMINRRQVRLREVLIDDVQQAYLADTSLVTGQVAESTISPGDLITASSVKLPVAVTRRQRVSVELNTGGIKITFNGIAQSEGAVGDNVEVQNAKTGQRFNATVVARGKVVAGDAIQPKKEDK
ncbi:MAG: flagellar basal body P-ring formation chaperone FlgA [Phycisphaeraceae bacterium]